jgi:hypothetical protein
MMNDNNKTCIKRRILPVILIFSLLLAAGGWGTAIYFNMTRTLKQNPDALENLRNNPLIAASDSGLLQAIERRNSASRGSFTGEEISEDALQVLGWAATGKNRDGTGFVIPLAKGAEPYVSLYLAQESGVRIFRWESNDFEIVNDDNILRQVSSGQNASAVWIYVIEKDKIPNGNSDWAWHAIGAMSEHQYLVADELDIQARFMASINADEVIALLGLGNKSLPSGVMAMSQK